MDQPLLQNEPIGRGTVVDALVARVRADILSGRYPPGSLLPPERALAASYGVTRTSLKHALVRLVQTGLVATKHGVGTRVLDHARLRSLELLPELVMADGPGWFVEIFETRREIGALVVARAAERATAEHHDRLTDLVNRVRTAADPDEAQVAECAIHRLFGEACGNRVYRILVDTLLDAYMPVRALFVRPFSDPPVAAARIAPVVEAVIVGDPADAHQAATMYLAETERMMLGQE
ncbi:FadR/GntR family transcriptional regulator [Actinocrispum wychmicini]|uniref:FadR/GntR family transcriptional regulator n=1 Tax=Actinocrispum wychmicini TaxID=1213861 RepID=UPI001A9DC86B|nr:GntR family transcriptional regulator [Actinocrispum wychmicini]